MSDRDDELARGWFGGPQTTGSLLDLLAHVRAEGLAEGIRRERAKVVAWLRSDMTMDVGNDDAADRIERWEHDDV